MTITKEQVDALLKHLQNQTTPSGILSTERVRLDAVSKIDIAAEIRRLPVARRRYLQVLPPSWLKVYPLYSQIAAMPELYNKGQVVWAALVQADRRLFGPDDESCLGEIIYDPEGKIPVPVLVEAARILFEMRNSAPEPVDQAEVANGLSRQMHPMTNFLFPQSIAELPLRISSIWFWRRHLLDGVLTLGFFPVIVSSELPGTATVLPSLFWPPDFREDWKSESRQETGWNKGHLEATVLKNLDTGNQDLPIILLEPPLTRIFGAQATTVANNDLHTESHDPAVASQGQALYEQAKEALENSDLQAPASKQAIYLLIEASDKGSIDATLKLAQIYREGNLLPKDEKKELHYMLKLAHGGHADACVEVASYYLLGKGCTKNQQAAQRWLTVAAELGHADAIELLAPMDHIINQTVINERRLKIQALLDRYVPVIYTLILTIIFFKIFDYIRIRFL